MFNKKKHTGVSVLFLCRNLFLPFPEIVCGDFSSIFCCNLVKESNEGGSFARDCVSSVRDELVFCKILLFASESF